MEINLLLLLLLLLIKFVSDVTFIVDSSRNASVFNFDGAL